MIRAPHSLLIAIPALVLACSHSNVLAQLGSPPVAVISAPSVAEYGQPILLDGSRSTAAKPKTLFRYTWTLLTKPGIDAFRPNSPVTIKGPTFEVPVSVDDPLPLGTHSFQLIVTDSEGLDSAPAVAQVAVQDSSDLAIETSPKDGSIEISWSSSDEGTVLNQTESLALPIRWERVTEPPTLREGGYSVVLPFTSTARFFLLTRDRPQSGHGQQIQDPEHSETP